MPLSLSSSQGWTVIEDTIKRQVTYLLPPSSLGWTNVEDNSIESIEPLVSAMKKIGF